MKDQKHISEEKAAMYDNMAQGYAVSSKRELREMTLRPSLEKYLDDLSGKRALDVGCGTGYSSRLLVRCGVREVVGIDFSQKEIEIAKSQADDVGIFLVRNILDDLSDLGKFDVVLASLSLYYFSKREEMTRAMENIRKVMKRGSFFIGVVTPHAYYNAYGTTIISETGEEGKPEKVVIRDFQGNFLLEFEDIYWGQQSYQESLVAAGFKVDWLPCLVSEGGIRKYGRNFWAEFLKNPLYKIWRAVK